jgi:hypothetical protein
MLSAGTDAMNSSSPGTAVNAEETIPASAPEPASAPAPSPAPESSSAPKSSSSSYVYYPAPPIISSIYNYQNVNNDNNLQDMETRYFLNKITECIKYDKSWKKLKKLQKHFKGDDGYEITYKLLRLFVKRGNTNWYDLKMQQDLVLDFIKHKLSKLGKN